MIDPNYCLSVRQQTELLAVRRSQVYYYPKMKNADNSEIANLIIEIQNPMYGYRRVTILLRQRGYHINHKRVFRLMRHMNVQAVYPKPKTTIRNWADRV